MQMITFNLNIVKADLALAMETLLWKYGSAIEGADNFKIVYNTKSDRAHNTLDASIIDNSWDTRSDEAIAFLKEFVSQVTTTASTSKVIAMSVTNRWGGNQTALFSLVKKYILDGMMSDWLAVTAPSEAPMYSTRLAEDEMRIKAELYTKKQPL